MDASGKRCAEAYVDQLFSKEEAHRLSEHLNRLGLKSDVVVKELAPALFEPDIYELTWLEEAETIQGLPGCLLGVEIVGYYDLSETEPVYALRDIETTYAFTAAVKRGLRRMEDDDQAIRFSQALGSRTGIYLRQEEGALRVTLGSEPPFLGSLSELYQEIVGECCANERTVR